MRTQSSSFDVGRAASVGILLLCLLFAACKGDGPSASDLSRIYSGNAINLISCAKAGDSVYRCRFSFTNPRSPADQGEHTQCFVTEGSRWEIKIFC